MHLIKIQQCLKKAELCVNTVYKSADFKPRINTLVVFRLSTDRRISWFFLEMSLGTSSQEAQGEQIPCSGCVLFNSHYPNSKKVWGKRKPALQNMIFLHTP